MADLIEVDSWDAGIYQLETTDPVEGGPGGIDNRQAQSLANRTKHLKALHANHLAAPDPHPQYMTTAESDAAIAAAVSALVNSSPAALDTLAEFAAALGNDPNFATTITNLLAAKAPLNSPAFTGNPTGTTQQKFDSSTKLATTEFVQSVGLRAPIVSVVATGTLPSTAGGSLVIVTSAIPTVQTLPLANSVPSGTKIEVLCAYANATIQRQGADNIQHGQSYIPSLVLSMNDTAVFESTGVTWLLIGGTALMRYSNADFGASLAASGYQKLPSGLIVQWVTGAGQSLAANSFVTGSPITFPISFPNACLSAYACAKNIQAIAGISAFSTTTATPTLGNLATGSAQTVVPIIFAIGN